MRTHESELLFARCFMHCGDHPPVQIIE